MVVSITQQLVNGKPCLLFMPCLKANTFTDLLDCWLL